MTKYSPKTEIVQCSVCKREFERYKKDRENKTTVHGRPIRPSYCTTCSKECSKIKLNTRKQWQTKINLFL